MLLCNQDCLTLLRKAGCPEAAVTIGALCPFRYRHQTQSKGKPGIRQGRTSVPANLREARAVIGFVWCDHACGGLASWLALREAVVVIGFVWCDHAYEAGSILSCRRGEGAGLKTCSYVSWTRGWRDEAARRDSWSLCSSE